MDTEQFASELPLSSGCTVVKTDECGLIAIDKKAGRATHPNPNPSPNAKPSMLRARYNFSGEYYSWEAEDGQKRRLYLINRLDSPTSGIVLTADNERVAQLARAEFKNKTAQKTYMAVCVGGMFGEGKWTDKLRPQHGAGFVRTSADFSGMPARTGYAVERHDLNGLGVTLVRLTPLTGLTHQLRVQCAMHRFPILGDATYGNFAFNKKFRAVSKINRLFLHCLKTRLELEIDGKKVGFEAECPLPESFLKTVGYNGEISKNLKF